MKNINARSEDFTLSCAIQDDGSMTFAHYSADGFSYAGSEGGIFTFKIKADENATAGSYMVDLKDMVLSIDGVGYEMPDRSSTLVINGTDGIVMIKATEIVDIYTLDGRKVRSSVSDTSDLPKGVYIVNGRKKVMKL